jgi:hypothetical protein
MKDVRCCPSYRSTGVASSPQKRTSSTSKHAISSLFSTFFVLDPDPDPEDLNQSGSTTLLLNPLMYCKRTPMLRCRGIVVATLRSNLILSRDT